MEENLTAVIGQLLMNCTHQSGKFKGWPILCSDPDFNDLPCTPDDLSEGDDYSEEDILLLSKAVLTWVQNQITSPQFNLGEFTRKIQQSLQK